MLDTSAGLWELTYGRPHIDALQLAAALEHEVQRESEPDFRTRLLIRDSLEALDQHWGKRQLSEWLMRSPVGERLQAIRCSELGPPGFPTLRVRIMDAVKPELIHQFLRELGVSVAEKNSLVIGGAVALILQVGLTRATDDVDIVDEIPTSIRSQDELLEQLAKRFGLRLTHFQSHYLPEGWENRLQRHGVFGQLEVFLVDPYDLVLRKLFSSRSKDLDDLRMVVGRLDRARLTEKYLTNTGSLRADNQLRLAAQRNWYVLFGESLPA